MHSALLIGGGIAMAGLDVFDDGGVTPAVCARRVGVFSASMLALAAIPRNARRPVSIVLSLTSEPVVGHTSTVASNIVEGVEAVEVIDRNFRDSLRIERESQVDGDAPPALFVDVQPAPKRDAAARPAEVEAQRLAAHVRLRRARNGDALTFVVVSPERAVATTGGAIAGRGAIRHTCELPSNRAAQA